MHVRIVVVVQPQQALGSRPSVSPGSDELSQRDDESSSESRDESRACYLGHRSTSRHTSPTYTCIQTDILNRQAQIGTHTDRHRDKGRQSVKDCL